MPRLFSYVIDHDYGDAPNPFGRYCTLAKCKYGSGGYKNVVELAEKGDWIVGTGGVDLSKSAGHGNLIYAMRVDEKLPLADYCNDKRFAKRVDAKSVSPTRGRFALISRHFFYFGEDAVPIPLRFRNYPLEKKGRGFRYKNFTDDFIMQFVAWLEGTFKPGKNGDPCEPDPDLPKPKCPTKATPKGCAR